MTTFPKREAVHLSGKAIDWRKPPAPNAIVKWSKKTIYGGTVKGSLRTICHLNRLNNLAKKRFGREVEVIQSAYNTSVPESKGTHDLDACMDIYIPGVSWWDQQRFFRANGFGCWYRHAPQFSMNHIHGFTLPVREGRSINDDFLMGGFRVGVYVDGGYSTHGRLVASSQLQDYYVHALGLSGLHNPGADRSWFPKNIEATIFDLDKYIARRVRKMKKSA